MLSRDAHPTRDTVNLLFMLAEVVGWPRIRVLQAPLAGQI
jgi:hypothetical protein